MLGKKSLERYAEVLLWGMQTARKEKFKKGDIVIVRYQRTAAPLAETVQRRLLEKGYNPVMRMELTPVMERNFFERSDNSQLAFVPPGTRELYENLNGSIFLHAPDSLTHLRGIDPGRIGKTAVAVKFLRDILNLREEKGLFGWTLCIFPTPELARHAGLSEKQYESQVMRACYLNTADPVKEWKSIHGKAAAIKKWLNALDVARFHVESERTDLRITPGDHRRWLGVSGHNIPSFELFMSPDWRGTEGVYYADQPSFRSGNYVEGIRLEFRKGRAVGVSARKGGDFLQKQIRMDKGASRVGEFSLTDKRFSKINRFMANTLFDENHGGKFGNCHIALGASYSDTFDGDASTLTRERKDELGFNDSALHWDLVNTENKRVTAELRGGGSLVIYDKGRFLES
jgi:aminopeptidase